MSVKRLEENPLLTPADLAPTREGLRVHCTLNPAAVSVGNETILLVRVGEQPIPDRPDRILTVVYDANADDVRTVSIPRDDPELDDSDPRRIFHRGRLLLQLPLQGWHLIL